MQQTISRPDAVRREAEALLRNSSLTLHEIALQLGITWQQVSAWSRRSGLRPLPATRQRIEAMQPARQAALRVLMGLPGVDIADLAEAAGFARSSAPVFLAVLEPSGGKPEPPPPERGAAWGEAPDPHRLRARLRTHIDRQIAAFDAALDAARSAPSGDPRGGIDTAKVRRDLGGLKRLLDDLASEAVGETCGEGPTRDAPNPLLSPDPEALRAEIARRYERFVGQGTTG